MAEQISMQVMMRLRQILREMAKHSKNIQENYRITVPQLVCLQEIFEHSPISIGALTKIVYMNNSTVTGIVDRLEKKELVHRVRISRDRRQVHLEITGAGIEFLKKAPTPLHTRFLERLQILDKEKTSMILWALEMLVDMLGSPEDPVKAVAPPTHVTPSPVDIEPSEEIDPAF